MQKLRCLNDSSLLGLNKELAMMKAFFSFLTTEFRLINSTLFVLLRSNPASRSPCWRLYFRTEQ